MAVTTVVCLSGLFAYSFAFIFDTPATSVPRAVTGILWVQHRGYWGSWGSTEYCEKGYYAVGYQMKIEEKQGNGDDTSLNGIGLVCGRLNGGNLEIGGVITSSYGPWGNWSSAVMCPHGKHTYLTQYAIQSEDDVHGADDTAANYVKFKCRNFEGGASSELVKPPGHGFWGDWSQWSETCPPNSAICGLQTKGEDALLDGDDTALNDVKFMCCPQD